MKERLKGYILFIVPQALVFAVLFTGLRLFEFLSIPHSGRLEAVGFLYDWPVAFVIIAAITAVGLLASFLNVAVAKFFSVVFFAFVLLGSFFLIRYFSVAQVPLGTDFFGYTAKDIAITVRSSGGVNVFVVIGFLFYLILFIGGSVKAARLQRLLSIKMASLIMGVIFVLALVPLKPSTQAFDLESDRNLVLNKTEFFVSRTIKHLRKGTGSLAIDIPPYPLLKNVAYHDALGEFFHSSDSLPNIVIVLVEGLGRDFVGPGADYGGFTPFLDSLVTKSLFWKNGLSNTGRTFGALPSVLGSLPYGENGFMSLGVHMPDHQTLISLLKSKGYKANFFYGGNPNFDNQDLFLQYEGIDYFLNETNFPGGYKKARSNADGFTWGFADRDVFNYAGEILQTQKKPRLDIYLTLTTHEPFIVPDERFENQFEEVVNRQTRADAGKGILTQYKDIFSCLLYTDNAIREFIARCKTKPEFQNTIFIITGDHRLVPVPQATRISRFRVPIIIYSPLLKQPATFESIVTHSDIAPSLLSFLSIRYGLTFPEKMPFISKGLRTSPSFSSDLDVALMRNKGEVNDYIFDNYFLSDERLFEITPSFGLQPVVNDSIKRHMEEQMNRFQAFSSFALNNNQLDKPLTKSQLHLFIFDATEKQFIEDENLKELTPDELFDKAQGLAFEKDFIHCRIILCYLLNATPNFHDARLLLARTFGWSEKYDTARRIVEEVLHRSPAYEDAYNALADIEFWDGHPEKSMTIVDDGLRLNPNNLELKVRQARVLWLNGKNAEARSIVENVLKLSPQNELASEMFQKMKQ